MGKRFLSVILVILMLTSIFPMTVSADNIKVKVILSNLPYGSEKFSDRLAAFAGYDTNDEWKYGYINPSGTVVISPTYDEVRPFSEGLAAVRQDDKWGYIDKTGKIVAPFIYDGALSFSDGRALVCIVEYAPNKTITDSSYWHGFIDKTGKVVIPLEYEYADSFSEGLASVRKDGKGGYIDKSGNTVIPFEYTRAGPFSEGLANVEKDGKYYHIDKTNKVIFSGYNSLPFKDGLALVGKTGNSGLYGYIDKSGELVIPYLYTSSYDFSEGLAVVRKGTYPDEKWGYIDKTGELFLYGVYDVVYPFNEGLAAVQMGSWPDCKIGYIDKTGKVVVPLEYTAAGTFNDGLAWVMKREGDKETWSVLQIVKPETKKITVTFGATRYILNGEPFTEQTMVYNDTAYLPAAYLATKLGLTAKWDKATNTTTLTSTGAKIPVRSGSIDIPAANPVKKTITATFGATEYILNGEPFDEQTMVYDGIAYLPAAYLATKLGLTAHWDKAANITTLTSKQ